MTVTFDLWAPYLPVNVGDPGVVVLPLADVESRLLGQLAEESEGLATAGGAHQRHALQGATERHV